MENQQDNRCSIEMPRYNCHKQVWALKIKRIEPSELDDGGAEITPAEAFENGYTKD